MPVRINLELCKTLAEQPDFLAMAAESPGFRLYWRNQDRDPQQAVVGLMEAGLSNKLAALAEEGSAGRSPLGILSRFSGASLEQQVNRHLPGGNTADAEVEFVPGNAVPAISEGSTVAVNIFSLEIIGNKLFVGGTPLLSFLANRIHRLCTAKLNTLHYELEAGGTLEQFMTHLLLEGSATLFFTVPTSGPIYSVWQQAMQRRESDVKLLRRYIAAGDNSYVARELELAFALTGNATLSARYPLGTWMCQVIEGAFGRSYLVDLLQRASGFVAAFEEARIKFGLPDKYSLWSTR